MDLNFEPWKKIGIVVPFIFIFDVLIVLFTSGSPFWGNKPAKVVFSDLLFFEGIIIFGIGALIASGYSALRIERWQSLYASPGGYTEYLREQRKKQVAFGIVCMLIGALLMLLAVAVSYLG
ncbi:hypothetical protein HM003_05225 [Candidatus Bathyarchaeota archaeon A05DMB-5]|jgi:hypothetical protein|nr:hypothetical protein [Candidatus Bathyarchaeota archaeon A05DMB-5]